MIFCSSKGWVAAAAGLWLSGTMDALAYVDPGSGSYIFQLLIAGLTAFVYFFSSVKRRFLALFRSRRDDALSVPPAKTSSTDSAAPPPA